MLAQVSNQGNVGNQNGDVVNENFQENVGNVIVNGNRVGNDFKCMMIEGFFSSHEDAISWKSELWNHAMVGCPLRIREMVAATRSQRLYKRQLQDFMDLH
ncbi:hypothetical protein Tco_0273882 [Tanacetum coccineum]